MIDQPRRGAVNLTACNIRFDGFAESCFLPIVSQLRPFRIPQPARGVAPEGVPQICPGCTAAVLTPAKVTVRPGIGGHLNDRAGIAFCAATAAFIR